MDSRPLELHITEKRRNDEIAWCSKYTMLTFEIKLATTKLYKSSTPRQTPKEQAADKPGHARKGIGNVPIKEAPVLMMPYTTTLFGHWSTC